MSTLVKYGSYTFPSPTPLVALDAAPIYYDTNWTNTESISIIGNLQDCSYSGLMNKKNAMVNSVLAQGINTVTIDSDIGDGAVISGCKLINISFPEANPTILLPYEITLEGYNFALLQDRHDVIDPQDSWSVSESENRILEISRTVSAKGLVKSNADDPLQKAKDYVTGRISSSAEDFLSPILFGRNETNVILFSDVESINEITSTYTRKLDYRAGCSPKELSTNGILRLTCTCDYNESDFTQVTINGTLEGGIDGVIASESEFTYEDAFLYAMSVYNQVLLSERSGALNSRPLSYSYTLDETENKLSFTFLFNDDPRNEVAVVDFSTELSTSDCFTNVSVSGVVRYVGLSDNISERLAAVETAYNSFNAFSEANIAYMAANLPSSPLFPNVIDESESRNADGTEITFSFTFSNKFGFDKEVFKTLDYSVDKTYPVQKNLFVELIEDYVRIEKKYESLAQKSLNGTASFYRTKKSQALFYIQNIKNQETPAQLTEDGFVDLTDESVSINESDSTINFSFSWTYQ